MCQEFLKRNYFHKFYNLYLQENNLKHCQHFQKYETGSNKKLESSLNNVPNEILSYNLVEL